MILLDPKLGEAELYKLGSIPEWVDRVFPEELVHHHISLWGEYPAGQGALNRRWLATDLVRPAEDTLKMTFGKRWFTGLQSMNREGEARDESLVSFLLVNSRTGEAVEVTPSESIPDERAAIRRLDGGLKDYNGWHATRPVLHRIGPRVAWVAPLLSPKDDPQGIGIVDLLTREYYWADSKAKAIRQFRRAFNLPLGDDLNQESGKVAFKLINGGILYFTSEENKNFRLELDDDRWPTAPFTQVGDEFNLGYIDEGGPVYEVGEFRNLTRNPEASPEAGDATSTGPQDSPEPEKTSESVKE